jgi:replicative DNA helicase
VTRVPPHDSEAEAALLGACFLSRAAWESALATVVPDDFYVPAHRRIFEAIEDLGGRGQAIDATTIAGWLHARDALEQVGGKDTLLRIQADTPLSAHYASYVRIVVEHSTRRQLLAAADRIASNARDLTVDVADVMALAAESVERAAIPVGGAADLDALAFVDQNTTERWVIPGLLQREERLLLIAAEGAGKSHLQRQMAVLGAAGVHPFQWSPIPPLRCLIVDLENPQPLIRKKLRPMLEPFVAQSFYSWAKFESSWLRVCSRTEGIDLTKRADQMWLAERASVNAQAMGGLDLLCIGPAYKMDFEATTNADGARRVQDAIDGIRHRHGCAVVLETHAPHESFSSTKARSLRPAGSRDWLRWPEFCRAIEAYPNDPNLRDCVDFYNVRGPRDERAWPRILRRGASPWPWVEQGYPRTDETGERF